MKKQLIVSLFLVLGGLGLPASAQYYRPNYHPTVEIFISGYHRCGTPIYSKRVICGRTIRVVPLSPCELRVYLERRHRLAAQRVIDERIARTRWNRNQSAYYYQTRRQGRRCR